MAYTCSVRVSVLYVGNESGRLFSELVVVSMGVGWTVVEFGVVACVVKGIGNIIFLGRGPLYTVFISTKTPSPPLTPHQWMFFSQPG